MESGLQYSALCDTSLEAYRLYCGAHVAKSFGYGLQLSTARSASAGLDAIDAARVVGLGRGGDSIVEGSDGGRERCGECCGTGVSASGRCCYAAVVRGFATVVERGARLAESEGVGVGAFGKDVDGGSGNSRDCSASGVVHSDVGADGRVARALGLDGDGVCGGCVGDSGLDSRSGVASGVLVGPNGGVSIGRGVNYERNRERRERGKRVRAVRRESGRLHDCVTVDERESLYRSRARRYVAENELAELRARHQVELERSKDLNLERKRREVKCLRDTEVGKVQIEKAFAALSAAGDVPGVGGSVRTVVSDGSSAPGLSSGSISPNSSVSMHEVHEMQKENLGMKREMEKIARVKEMAPDLYQIWFGERKTMTADTGYTCENGMPVALKGDPDLVGYIDGNKRFHYGPDPNYEEYDLYNY